MRVPLFGLAGNASRHGQRHTVSEAIPAAFVRQRVRIANQDELARHPLLTTPEEPSRILLEA